MEVRTARAGNVDGDAFAGGFLGVRVEPGPHLYRERQRMLAEAYTPERFVLFGNIFNHFVPTIQRIPTKGINRLRSAIKTPLMYRSFGERKRTIR